MRRLYRIDRAPRLGGEHPFPAGPLLRGGVAWLGVIQRPGRLAISRASASVSAVLSARACPLHPVGRVWPSSHDQPVTTLRRGAPSHLRCVYGSVRPRTCTVSNGNPVARGRAPALSECMPQDMFLHDETRLSGDGGVQGLVRSRPWGVDSVPSGRIGAGPHLSLLFREHLPHLVVTVLPPYADAYLAGVLGILISQSQSCVMRPCWQARPGPVCAASRPILATASVGAGPHRERQRCAEWKKPWHVFSLLLFGWGLLRLGGPGAASCARFSSCG